MPGSWQLPQGGLEKAERPLDAAWRELGEETGLGPGDVELRRRAPRVGARTSGPTRSSAPAPGSARSNDGSSSAPCPTTSSRRRTDGSSGHGAGPTRRGSSGTSCRSAGSPTRARRPCCGDSTSDHVTVRPVHREASARASACRSRSRQLAAPGCGRRTDRRPRRPTAPARAGTATAPARRAGPPLVGAAVGTARARARPRWPSPSPGPRRGPSSRCPPSRPASRTCGRSSSGPASASASTTRARSCSSTRSIASPRRSRTPCCPAVEDGTLVLIGATTENPFFEVNPPLRSRSTLFRLEPLGPDDLRVLVGRGLDALGTDGRRRGGRRCSSSAAAATDARC